MENFETELLDANLPTNTIKKVISEKRTKRGFKLMAIGATTLLSGCITNLIMPSMNDTYNYVLYGVTSTGATIVFLGLYFVLE